MDAADQAGVDARLCDLDGTENKSRLGAECHFGSVTCPGARPSWTEGVPLYRYLGGEQAAGSSPSRGKAAGLRGSSNINFQDFQVIPLRPNDIPEALHDAVMTYKAMKGVLKARGVDFPRRFADEGGYAPRLASNEAGFEVIVEAIRGHGLTQGKDAAIAVDVAASLPLAARYLGSPPEHAEWTSGN